MSRTRIALSAAAAVTSVATLAIAATAPTALAHATDPPADHPGPTAGAVYVLGNQPSGNAVIAYDRDADGTLTPAGQYPTGGLGTGAGLGSQNAVILDDAGRHLYAVNAGSDTLSSFAVTRGGLRLLSTVDSGGDVPISVTVHGDRLYALNTGSGGSISGFRVDDGRLSPLRGSTRGLSGTAADAAQVQFSPDGRELVVTEKGTSLIDVYRVGGNGVPAGRTSVPSEGSTPFGFDFTPSGDLAVSEAGPSAASTYDVRPTGLRTLSASVGNTQAAACWLVVTDDGRFAYTGNGGGSLSISSYRVGRHAALSLLDGRSAPTTGGVTDIALSTGSDYLYARLGDGTVGAFDVQRDGSLVALLSGTGLPAGTAGIAAR